MPGANAGYVTITEVSTITEIVTAVESDGCSSALSELTSAVNQLTNDYNQMQAIMHSARFNLRACLLGYLLIILATTIAYLIPY